MGIVTKALSTKIASIKSREKFSKAREVLAKKASGHEKLAAAFNLVIGALEKQAIDPATMAGIKYWGRRLGSEALPGAVIGAGTGAIAGGEGNRLSGAARGAVYGGAAGIGANEMARKLISGGHLGSYMKKVQGLGDNLHRAQAYGTEALEAAAPDVYSGVLRAGESMGARLPNMPMGHKVKRVAQIGGTAAGTLAAPAVAGSYGGAGAKKKTEKDTE